MGAVSLANNERRESMSESEYYSQSSSNTEVLHEIQLDSSLSAQNITEFDQAEKSTG